MKAELIQFPPGGGGGRGRVPDPYRLLSAKEAAERVGLSYWAMLEIFRAHGKRIGGRYYMTEARLVAFLEASD